MAAVSRTLSSTIADLPLQPASDGGEGLCRQAVADAAVLGGAEQQVAHDGLGHDFGVQGGQAESCCPAQFDDGSFDEGVVTAQVAGVGCVAGAVERRTCPVQE